MRAAVALLLATAAAATGVAAENRTAASACRSVPADATVALLVRDLPQLRRDWKSSSLNTLWQDEQVRRFFAPLRERAEMDGWDARVREETGYGYEELLDLFPGDAALYLPRLEEALASDDAGDPVAVFLAQVGANADKVEELLLRRERRVGADGKPELVATTRKIAGVTLHVDRRAIAEGEREEMAWALFDGLLAVTTTASALETVVGAARTDAPRSSLQDVPVFVANGTSGLASDALLFVNIDRLLPPLLARLERQLAAEPGQQPMPFNVSAALETLALDNLQALSVSIDLDKGTASLTAALTYEMDRGVVRLLAYGPGAAPRPAFIPASATGFSTGRFDFVAAWTALEEVLKAASPGLLAMGTAQLQAYSQQSGVTLDLRRDLLENLTGEIVSVQSQAQPAAGASSAPTLGPDQVIAAGIRDRAALERTLDAALKMISPGGDLFANREYRDTVIHAMQLPTAPAGDAGQAPTPSSISYAVTDSHLLVGIGSGSALESLLAALHEKGASVWDRPQVKAALAALPAGATAIQYQDMAASGESLLQMLAGMARLAPQDAQVCDPEALPDRTVLARHLGTAVSGVWRDGRSVTLRVKLLPPAQAGR